MQHQVAAVYIMAVQSARLGIGECRLNVLHGLRWDPDPIADTVIKGATAQASKHQIVTTDVEALRERWMGADAAIDLGLGADALSPGGIDLDHQLRMVWMQQRGRVVPTTKGTPGIRQVLNPYRLMGVDAPQSQPDDELSLHERNKVRESASEHGGLQDPNA